MLQIQADLGSRHQSLQQSGLQFCCQPNADLALKAYKTQTFALVERYRHIFVSIGPSGTNFNLGYQLHHGEDNDQRLVDGGDYERAGFELPVAVKAYINNEIGGAEATTLGDQVRFAKFDVREEEDWRRVLDMTAAKDGRLDVLVNN